MGFQPFSRIPIESPHWGSVDSMFWPLAALTGFKAVTFTQQVPGAFQATRKSASLTKAACYKMRIQRSRLERTRQEVKITCEGSWEANSWQATGLGGKHRCGGKMSRTSMGCRCLQASSGWGQTTSLTVYHGGSVFETSCRREEFTVTWISQHPTTARVISKNPRLWITWFEILFFNRISLWFLLFLTVHSVLQQFNMVHKHGECGPFSF